MAVPTSYTYEIKSLFNKKLGEGEEVTDQEPETDDFVETFLYVKRNQNCRSRGSKDLTNSWLIVWPYRFQRLWYWVCMPKEWIIIGLAAIVTGFSALWIEMIVRLLSDWKIGFCSGAFAFNRDLCCGGSSGVDFGKNQCKQVGTSILDSAEVTRSVWKAWRRLFFSNNGYISYVFDYLVYVTTSVVFATSASLLCCLYSLPTTGSGIPEMKTILSGNHIPQFLNPWTGPVKCLSLCLAVSSGLALGKEGPLVHISCCWAVLLSEFFSSGVVDKHEYLELLSAACAVGVSVAFGAPLGGVLFSFEEMSTIFPPRTLWKAFFGAVIGTLAFKWFDQVEAGRSALFGMDTFSFVTTWKFPELLPFALIGVIGGLIGALLIHLNVYWIKRKTCFRIISRHPMSEVIIITLLSSSINYIFPMLRVPYSVLLQQLFKSCGKVNDSDIFFFCTKEWDHEASYSYYSLNRFLMFELILLAAIRFLQTCFTFGIGVPAGIFIPTITVGALCGRAVGLWMIWLNEIFGLVNCHKCIHPNVYALVGAVAVTAGATRATISLAIIAFELTAGSSSTIPFMMIAVMIAKWVGDTLCPYSIYDYHIRLKGYPFLRYNQQVNSNVSSKDIITNESPTLTATGETIQSIQDLLINYPYEQYAVVRSRQEQYFVGYVFHHDIASALRAACTHYFLEDLIPVVFIEQETEPYCASQHIAQPVVPNQPVKSIELSCRMLVEPRKDSNLQSYSEQDAVQVSVLNLSFLLQTPSFQISPSTTLTDVILLFKYFNIDAEKKRWLPSCVTILLRAVFQFFLLTRWHVIFFLELAG